jgi:hypothetical protein
MNVRRMAPIYRKTGLGDKPPEDITEVVEQVKVKLAYEILCDYPNEDGGIAKRMKHSRSILENEFHMHSSPDDMPTGELFRRDLLLKTLDELGGPSPDWYSFFCMLNCSNRMLLEVSYMFHLLATEDRDPVDLYMNTYAKMHDERRYEEAVWRPRINNCSYLFLFPSLKDFRL